ncbi:MAG: UbiA family prenyltransferase [Bryobacteraceae bacterium]|nr:UbiA family prenyltransferase [Bryobacteraceae bacterium]
MTQPNVIQPVAATIVPLCVDLDGTLLRSDTLYESVFDAITNDYSVIFRLPFLLLRGKAHLKQKVSELTEFDPETLPWREDLIRDLKELKESGRRLILVTAAAAPISRAVAAHLGFFDEVISSSETHNLKGKNKVAKLVELFGERGFDYVGDANADFYVWRSARHAWVVGKPSFAARARSAGIEVERVYEEKANPVRAFWKGMRAYQWVKNLLIFAPMLMAHHFQDGPRWIAAVTAFFSFSLMASAGYLINDLLDRRNDRLHVRKRKRPFASGDLPLTWAALIPVLVLTAIALAASLSLRSLEILLLYFVFTFAYSVRLKNRAIIDVVILSCLYSSRIAMGSYATRTPVSVWLISFSIFVFFTLALAKRAAELRMWERSGKLNVPGRGYTVSDLPIVEGMGVGSAYVSALVLALYLQSPSVLVLYRHPRLLWLILPLLLAWLSHVWLVTHRGEMTDDPILFALKNRMSLAIVGAIVLLAVLAV